MQTIAAVADGFARAQGAMVDAQATAEFRRDPEHAAQVSQTQIDAEASPAEPAGLRSSYERPA